MNPPQPPPGRWATTVKLGPKSQIVIPKEVRELLGLEPGDLLLLLADKERGIALVDPAQHSELMNALMGAAFAPPGAPTTPPAPPSGWTPPGPPPGWTPTGPPPGWAPPAEAASTAPAESEPDAGELS